MLNNKWIVLLLFVCSTSMLHAQATTEVPAALTLQQALAFAKENSPALQNTNIDLEIAKKKIWETTAMGLPQVNSKLSGSYMLTIPDAIKSFSNFGQLFSVLYMHDTTLYGPYSQFPKPEAQEPTEDKDLRWGATFDVTVSQLVFSGAYLVGLQTASVYKQLSELSITKSENDLIESVTNAYYLVLVAEENKTILDTTFFNMTNLLNQMRELNKQGMIDETDVDQLQLTVSTIENSRNMIARQIAVARNLLKFQMGYPMDKEIVLAEKLEALMASSDMASLLTKGMNVSSNVDYKLLETQTKLAGLNLKLQKSTFLPDVFAFYQHQENFNEKSLSFTPPDMIGVSVSIPIFGSGLKLAKVRQAKLGVEKMENAKRMLESGLKTGFSEAQASYQTYYEQYLTTKQNVALAKKIYNKTLIKYKEGMASSLELTQAQNQYLQAQSSFYTTIISLNTAKQKLEKLIK